MEIIAGALFFSVLTTVFYFVGLLTVRMSDPIPSHSTSELLTIGGLVTAALFLTGCVFYAVGHLILNGVI